MTRTLQLLAAVAALLMLIVANVSTVGAQTANRSVAWQRFDVDLASTATGPCESRKPRLFSSTGYTRRDSASCRSTVRPGLRYRSL